MRNYLEYILNIKQNNILRNKNIKSKVFHKITKLIISDAFNNQSEFDNNVIEAILTKRVFDNNCNIYGEK